MSDDNLSMFGAGMVFVVKEASQRITEDRPGLVETDAMLALIAGGFGAIPYKVVIQADFSRLDGSTIIIPLRKMPEMISRRTSCPKHSSRTTTPVTCAKSGGG
jgi:hypothetical protein